VNDERGCLLLLFVMNVPNVFHCPHVELVQKGFWIISLPLLII